MVQSGFETSLYLREGIKEKIDELVSENKELYVSRSQFINSVLHQKLRELGKFPVMEEQ